MEGQNLTNQRKEIIDRYLKENAQNISQSQRLQTPLLPQTNLTVVVPAYNEEATVGNLIYALSKQNYPYFEVMIVDNGSDDKTTDVILSLQKRVGYPLYLVSEPKPGPGNARKRGMDEALIRVREFYQENYPSYIVALTDADATPSPDWLEQINKAFRTIKSGAVAGTHGGSKLIDQIVFQKLGISSYFNRVPNLIEHLVRNNIGQLKLSGPNCAFEIEAYAAAGGMRQPYEDGKKIGIKEVPQLGERVRKKGYSTLFLKTRVVASQRRHLFELLHGGDHNQYLKQHTADGRFLPIRDDEMKLLEEALATVPKTTWVSYQQEMIKAAMSGRTHHRFRK